MRLKEINNKVAHVAWSPLDIQNNYIASGSASENLDTSASSASLDLFKLDLSNTSTDLQIDATINTESRFSKLIWSNYSFMNSKNLIIGGCENTKIYLYDYEKILTYQHHLNQKDTNPLVNTLEKHTSGSVSSLDINPYQHNLLASGAGASEIFIWDLNNPSVPMTPGTKIQPLDDINCVAWNHQVQHILASTCSGKCVVWDLRKNESIIKVSDNMSKMKAKLVAWHPDIATQMCLSSDDDQSPYLQIWDLRFATSPVRILEGHQRGILSFQWCTDDANLLISSAKDNRIICWNPNNPTCNGEILYELPTIGQWCFDLSWCKRNPDLICASSFEGQINVYSLMGGKYNVIQQTSSKIMDSFGDVPSTPPAASQQQQITQIIPQLKTAPKWMKRPCGASFAFGGKLVTFGRSVVDQAQQQNEQSIAAAQMSNQRIVIKQVITDTELVDKSQHLESTLQTGNLIEFCNYKIETAVNDAQTNVWQFILASFNPNKNEKYLELLGFSNENLEAKISKSLKVENNGEIKSSNGVLEDEFDSKLNIQNGTSTLFNHNENNFDEIARTLSPIDLSFKNEMENLISELLLLGRYDKAVELCIQENKFTEAILIANLFDKDLLVKTQRQYFRKNKSSFSGFLDRFLNRDWSKMIETCNLNDWKDGLAALLTYTNNQEFSVLCDKLGQRLEESGDSGEKDNLLNACICYILSFNLENLVSCWQKVNKDNDSDSSQALQDLIEKVMVLRYCYQNVHPELNKQILDRNQSLTKLNANLVKYAKLLADQGSFLNAYSYINDSNDSSIQLMKDRIYNVLDVNLIKQHGLRKPDCPFRKHETLTKTSSYPHQHQQHFNPVSATGYHGARKTSTSYQGVQDPFTQSKQPNSYNYNSSAASNTFQPQSTYPLTTPAATSNAYPSSFNPSVQQTAPPPSIVPSMPPSQTLPPTANIFTPSAPISTSTNLPNSQVTAMPSYMNTKPPTAWNDPPIVAPKIKQAPVIKEPDMTAFFQPTMPAASMPTMPGPMSYYPTSNPQQPTYQQPSYTQPIMQQQFDYNSQAKQQLPSQTFNPSLTNVQQQQQQRVQPSPLPQVQQPQQIEKPPPGPIPQENQIIQSVFDTLLSKCLSNANTPVLKRKLDDVAKKLELLYDKLRDSSLSPSVVQGLHSMIQYIQTFDYQSTLLLHTQIVGTSNFTEISGFMPGIKVLIQSCQQLNVTL